MDSPLVMAFDRVCTQHPGWVCGEYTAAPAEEIVQVRMSRSGFTLLPLEWVWTVHVRLAGQLDDITLFGNVDKPSAVRLMRSVVRIAAEARGRLNHGSDHA